MDRMNSKVDIYLSAGCGRCPLGNTPECKVNDWQEELRALRQIVLDCGLDEELKWGVPVYTLRKNNIVTISALKHACVLSFFKGALLKDANGILTKPGENSQAGRVIRFANVREIAEKEEILKAYIHEAVEIEKAGLKVDLKTNPEPVPEELQKKLDENPEFSAAFRSLTPGRQRGYILHFSQPKQATTRAARIEKLMPQILIGKGLNDR